MLVQMTECAFSFPNETNHLLSGLDVRVEAGECIRVLGRNGSGKSTFLKLISGGLEPTAGERAYGTATKAVYMDQSAGHMLAEGMTIGEHLGNLATGRGPAGFSSLDMLDDFGLGLEHRVNEFAGHLSGGQRQIVSLLAVLGVGANLICLDEFTSALDPISASCAATLINDRLAAGGIAVVAVSHSDVALQFTREMRL